MTRIAIVNRFFPPDPAITGQSARELADFLRKRLPEAKIRIYATQADYGGGQMRPGELQHDVRRIRSWYSGKQKLLRLAASLHDGLRLAWMASRDADVVISLTDPPLLGLWMGLTTRLRRRRWIEWTMDLYPEAFAAAGLIGRRHPLFRALSAAIKRVPPKHYICLGPQQHAYIEKTRGIEAPAFVLPCGMAELEPGPAPDWRKEHAGKIVVVYAGNLGEAHSAEVVEELVLRANRRRITFLLAPYGSKASALRRRLAATDGIEWRAHVPTAELSHADVHMVSLRAEWTHVCVPSKAVTAVSLGRPVIYAGVPAADNWALLSDASWLIPEGPDRKYARHHVERVLTDLVDREALAAKTRAAHNVRARLLKARDDAFEQIALTLQPTSPLSDRRSLACSGTRGQVA